MKLSASDLREIQLFKYYRLVRKWACKTYDLNDADLELLIYLDCKQRFTRQEFIDGTYTYSWDKQRWERLRSKGWIEVWRHRNRTSIKFSIFKTSFKCSFIIFTSVNGESRFNMFFHVMLISPKNLWRIFF